MKNLKTIIILCAIFFALNANAQSEKGFYINANAGYNKGMASTNLIHALFLNAVNQNETSANTGTTEVVALTFGDGLNFGANVGFMFNKNIGFELGANYLLGGTIKSSFKSFNGDFANIENSSKMLQIRPTLVFRAGYDKINPYAKIGMLIGSGRITNTQSGKKSSDTYSQTREFSGGTPIGFQGGLGLTYQINNKISLFGELSLTSLEYAPKKGITTVSVENGIDQLPSQTIYDKEIEFLDSFTETGLPVNPNEPSKQVKIPFNFNSFGLNIGLQYHF